MTREEAIQILSTRDAHGVLCGYTSGVTEALDMAIEALKKEPRKGEWITDKDGYSVCSECGFSFGCIECPHEETDFCPKCGARLDKGGEEE